MNLLCQAKVGLLSVKGKGMYCLLWQKGLLVTQ